MCSPTESTVAPAAPTFLRCNRHCQLDCTGWRHVSVWLRLFLAFLYDKVAYSCDKNFALYRERVGALWVQSSSTSVAVPVRENLLVLARSLWSMPPDHGAAAVRLILEDDALAADWRQELACMRERINDLRSQLGAAHPALASIARQEGLFALLPITLSDAAELRTDQGVYLPNSGRINIAGLTSATIGRFVDAPRPFLAS